MSDDMNSDNEEMPPNAKQHRLNNDTIDIKHQLPHVQPSSSSGQAAISSAERNARLQQHHQQQQMMQQRMMKRPQQLNNVIKEHQQQQRKRPASGGTDEENKPSTSVGNNMVSANDHGTSPNSAAGFDQRVTPQLVRYMEETEFVYITDIQDYEKLSKIGQGTFGEVFKARNRKTERLVALKKILTENEKEGFPITALREVKTLQRIKHENVTELIEVCAQKSQSGNNRGRSTFFLVLAYCDHDLAGILSDTKIKFNTLCSQSIMGQIFTGLEKCHKLKVLHRDMKAANILLTQDGVVKLADFGLSRQFTQTQHGPQPLYTNRVVTLWYRPPELLLGERCYSTAIDNWGAGCILAELWTRHPIMQGDTEQKQLTLISTLCGPINETTMPGVSKLPLFGKMQLPTDGRKLLRTSLGKLMTSPEALNLCEHLLNLDPLKRFSAQQSLASDFFLGYDADAARKALQSVLQTVRQSHYEYTAAKFRGVQAQPQQAAAQHSSSTASIMRGQMVDRVF